jgi:GH15 family glucan-1,4-alpha-glucosidase
MAASRRRSRAARIRRSGCRAILRSASRAAASAHATCCSGGEQRFCSLSWDEGLTAPVSIDEANGRLGATTRFWRIWLGRARIPDHRWAEYIQRSALAIKGLTYMPTGATVAALTTSLPETPGGERNWDYRYTWMRDASFTLRASAQSGLGSGGVHAVHRPTSSGARTARFRSCTESTAGASWSRRRGRISADEIRADILARGVDERGVLRQHYATDALDASNLLAALYGLLPGHDERMHRSVMAIAEELTQDGLVLRYRTSETDDGLAGEEGTFLICSFWLVAALTIVGEQQRALDLMERLLREASPLGLYAEEFDTATGRHLGNFPQAFSHLALLDAAARLILQERLSEI